MPYKLRKLPGKDLYKVYSEDGKPHSKEGLTLEMAKKQMTALNIAYSREKHNSIQYVKMPAKDYLEEHKLLIKILDLAGTEGKRQKKEVLKELGIKL